MGELYNEKVAFVSGVASGALHIYAHMYFAGWSFNEGIESMVTWVMAVSAFVFMWVLLTEKDNYHGN